MKLGVVEEPPEIFHMGEEDFLQVRSMETHSHKDRVKQQLQTTVHEENILWLYKFHHHKTGY